MSDDELDREWKPNARPQSTMARSFSAALNDLFKIDNSLADLDAAVDQKKKAVLNQTSELEALESRLKATEERLKQRQSMSHTGMSSFTSQSPRRRAPLADTFVPPAGGEEPHHQQHHQQQQQPRNQTTPLATEARPKTPTRPQTGKREPSYTTGSSAPPMPGALPPTPGTSEGDSSAEEEEEEEDEEKDDNEEEEEEEEEEEDDDDEDDEDEDEGDGASADFVVVPEDGASQLPVPPPRSSHRPAS